MIKVKFKDVLNAANSLKLKELNEGKYTAIGFTKVLKICKKVDEELTIYSQVHNQKVKDYGVEKIVDEKPQGFWIPQDSENAPKFEEEINLLLDKEIEIDAEKLKIEDLAKNEKDFLLMSPSTFTAMPWLIEF